MENRIVQVEHSAVTIPGITARAVVCFMRFDWQLVSQRGSAQSQFGKGSAS